MLLAQETARAIAHVTDGVLRGAIYGGHVKSYRIEGRRWVDRDSLDEWIRSRQVPEGYIKTGEAAERVRLNRTTILDAVKAGKVEYWRPPPGAPQGYCINIESLDAWYADLGWNGVNCIRCGIIPEPDEPPLNDEHHCRICQYELQHGRVYPGVVVATLPACKHGRLNGR